jgi:hypothetical protein
MVNIFLSSKHQIKVPIIGSQRGQVGSMLAYGLIGPQFKSLFKKVLVVILVWDTGRLIRIHGIPHC